MVRSRFSVFKLPKDTLFPIIGVNVFHCSYILLALCWATNRNYRVVFFFFHAVLFRRINLPGVKKSFHNDHVSKQIQWQKKKEEKRGKKNQLELQKKYLSADLCHKEITASDPPLIQSSSHKSRFLRLLLISVKDAALSVENKIQCSHMFIAPATPFPLMINNQTCHPEQTKLEGRERGGGAQWSWKRSAIPRKARAVFPQWAGRAHTSTVKPSE